MANKTHQWFWSFVAITEKEWFLRRSRELHLHAADHGISAREILILRSIMVVESSQRPMMWRAFERIVDFLEKISNKPRKRTLGYFQITDAPVRFSGQIDTALKKIRNLQKATPDFNFIDLARFWNGSSVKQPGAALGYVDALKLAIQAICISDQERGYPIRDFHCTR